MKSKVKMIDFVQNGDRRGYLVVMEGGQDVPFDIARAFYIYGSDASVVRGKHANRKTQFVLVNVAGTSKVKIIAPDGEETVYELNRPHMGLYIPAMTWKEMYDFSKDSVLLCLASEHYDAAEYIRDFAEYVKETGKRQ